MMDYRFDPLWLRLSGMSLPGFREFMPFMQMLEKQMGLNRDMAQRVIEEYRKFLFLAMRAGHQVMPPGILNDVWTLHMQNAQAYWDSLSQIMGGSPTTERGPETGGPSAMADPWTATLESYERIFGMKPPMDIWGKPAAQANPWEEMARNMRRMFGLE